ncbi:DUF805 domain-containing protein [uncultured Modestobacter sp.]|uniref:DUF805 domain-containing protein n=1 Tax=uncultured Modestobacter sp. TaxID=380048 RepID=UPI00261E2495|nr:DUF805 domain-containing protein [uncultured Modestobacter sp.]
MSFGNWYVSRGRITRRTFWLHYFLPILAVSVLAGLLDIAFGFTSFDTSTADSTSYSFDTTSGPIGLVVSLLTLVPSVSSTVTRLHDRGHSAWWLLFLLLPVIGWIVLIVQTWFLPGQPHDNGYGPLPAGRQPMADPAYPTSYS